MFLLFSLSGERQRSFIVAIPLHLCIIKMQAIFVFSFFDHWVSFFQIKISPHPQISYIPFAAGPLDSLNHVHSKRRHNLFFMTNKKNGSLCFSSEISLTFQYIVFGVCFKQRFEPVSVISLLDLLNRLYTCSVAPIFCLFRPACEWHFPQQENPNNEKIFPFSRILMQTYANLKQKNIFCTGWKHTEVDEKLIAIFTSIFACRPIRIIILADDFKFITQCNDRSRFACFCSLKLRTLFRFNKCQKNNVEFQHIFYQHCSSVIALVGFVQCESKQ